MPPIYQYSFPTEIHFGPGAIEHAADLLLKNKVKRPLILTDKMMAEFLWVKNLQEDLQRQSLPCAISAPVSGNPDSHQVSHGLIDFHAHDADAIIAVGGGAALDVAKAVALMAHHEGSIFDYEDGNSTREIDQKIPFVMAIPTTAGTGSEVGRSTVISHPDTHEKKIIFHPRLLAKVVIADPELTLGLPAHLTAATGMDALTHLIESFLAKGTHPMCDGIALEGIHLTAQSLKQCVRFAQEKGNVSDDHKEARSKMMHAAMMGAVAFQKGLGLNHSCAHALSTVNDMHHGLANAIMLPFCMSFNYRGNEQKFARMAQAAGLSSDDNFIDWLKKLRKDIGIFARLSDAGVKERDVNALVAVALKDGCHASNPKVVSAEDFRRIFVEAL